MGRIFYLYKLFPDSQKLSFYSGQRSADAMKSLPCSISDGITRKAGAIGGGISLARIVGWKKIVLIGVDLYDSRYFWLKEDEIRNKNQVSSTSQQHPTVSRNLQSIVKIWSEKLADEGYKLEVYNPRSLLISILPQFKWEDGMKVHGIGKRTL